ncbi:serine hydrolase, partial [Roseomonas populi]
MTSPDLPRAVLEAASICSTWAAEGGPGGALVVFDTAGPREVVAGGLASLEHGLPFTPATPTRWASISKQFCATTALLAGFRPEDRLAALVPGLAPAIGALPLARAMDMTGAIPDLMETLWLLGLPFSASLSEAELLELCRRLPGTGGAPGEEMAYSNTG